MSAIIDSITNLVSASESPETAPQSVDELETAQKWEIAQETAFRCSECETPEFHHWLYLVPGIDADTDDLVPVCESCLAEAERDEEATDETKLPRPQFGQKGYLIDVDRTETKYRKNEEVEVKAIEEHEHDKDSYYMGEFGRALVETKKQHPRDQLWLGYDERAHKMTTLGIDIDQLIQHVFITGGTGRGKSTLAITIAMQLAYGDYGFAIFDPHTELVEQFLTTLPPSRRDDVIWINPSPGDEERIAGLNFLEIDLPPDHPYYDRAVKGALEDLRGVLKGGDYWGNKMNGIVMNIAQGMILSETSYTLIDMHEIFLDQERRKEFAAKMVAEDHWFVARYTKEIAAMDNDEMDAVVRRVNEWVAHRTSREIIAHKSSSIDLDAAIEEGKILVVDNNVGTEDMQKMIATAIIRRIYRICKRRKKEAIPSPEHPFFLLIDELDDILSDELGVRDMVKNARKYGLSLILLTQSPNELEDEKLVNTIGTNCKTKITFANPYEKEAKSIAGLYDCEYTAVTKLGNFTMLVMREPDGTPKGPYEIEGFPDYPPLRTLEEAKEWIVKPSLQRHGVERLSDREIWYDSLDEHASAVDENTEGEGPDASDDGLTSTQINGMRAAYDTSVRQGNAGGPIAIAEVLDKLHDYTGLDYNDPNKAWREVYQDIPTTQVDSPHTATDEEPTRIIIKDRPWLGVGESATSGGQKHQSTMADAYVPLTQLGFVVDILDQSDGEVGEALPDAIARLDDVLDTDDLDPIQDRGEIADRVESFRQSDEYEVLVRLAGTKDAYIESEHTTTGSQPSQAVKNAIEAHKDGHRCLFLCRPELAEKLHSYLADEPKGCCTGRSTDGEDHYYTKSGKPLTIDSEEMTRHGTKDNDWLRDLDTGEYILRDSSGTEYARFETPMDIFTDAEAYPEGGDRNILPPVIPQHELDGDSMADIEWDIIEVPHRAAVDPEYDPEEAAEDEEPRQLTPLDLQLYQHNAENVPLIDLPVSSAETHSPQQPSNAVVYEALNDAASTLARSND